MRIDPTTSTPSERATSDSALLVPTAPVPTAPVPTAPVPTREIAEFLRHLTDLHTNGCCDDPDARAVFLTRKAELFSRLAADPSAPAPARRTS